MSKAKPEKANQVVIIAGVDETVRAVEVENILLATCGLNTCIAIGFVGKNGKKSLTHLSHTNLSIIITKEDYSFGFDNVIEQLIDRELKWIGESSNKNIEAEICNSDMPFSIGFSHKVYKMLKKRDIVATQRSSSNGAHSLCNEMPDPLAVIDSGKECARRSNLRLSLSYFMQIIYGTFLPEVMYENGWKESILLTDPKSLILLDKILNQEDLCQEVASMTGVSDKKYVHERLEYYKGKIIKLLSPDEKALIKFVAEKKAQSKDVGDKWQQKVDGQQSKSTSFCDRVLNYLGCRSGAGRGHSE